MEPAAAFSPLCAQRGGAAGGRIQQHFIPDQPAGHRNLFAEGDLQCCHGADTAAAPAEYCGKQKNGARRRCYQRYGAEEVFAPPHGSKHRGKRKNGAAVIM